MRFSAPVLRRLALVPLILLAIAPLTLSTGCSWFRKKPKQAENIGVDTGTNTTTGGGTMTEPVSTEPEGRIGGITGDAPMRTIYFDYDRSEIRADQLENMEFNLGYLTSNPEVDILIEGHCDERGTTEYNFALGERRAETVKAYYVKNGVADARLQILSKGEEEPVDPGHDESAWSQNRRAHFKLITLK